MRLKQFLKKTLKAFLENQSKNKFYLFFANNFKEGFSNLYTIHILKDIEIDFLLKT